MAYRSLTLNLFKKKFGSLSQVENSNYELEYIYSREEGGAPDQKIWRIAFASSR